MFGKGTERVYMQILSIYLHLPDQFDGNRRTTNKSEFFYFGRNVCMYPRNECWKLNNGKSLSMREKIQVEKRGKLQNSPTVFLQLSFCCVSAIVSRKTATQPNRQLRNLVRKKEKRRRNTNTQQNAKDEAKKEERAKKKSFIVAHFARSSCPPVPSTFFHRVFFSRTTSRVSSLDTRRRRRSKKESSMKPGSVWKSIKLLNLKDIEVSSTRCLHASITLSHIECKEHVQPFKAENYVIFLFLKMCNKQPFSLLCAAHSLLFFEGI